MPATLRISWNSPLAALVDFAATGDGASHLRVAPVIDLTTAVDGRRQVAFDFHHDMTAAIDGRVRVRDVHRADIDPATTLHGSADAALIGESAVALDSAAARDANTLNVWRCDCDFEIVFVRAAFVAGLDDELVSVLDVDLRVLGAAFFEAHLLGRAVTQHYVTAAFQFDGIEWRDRNDCACACLCGSEYQSCGKKKSGFHGSLYAEGPASLAPC